MTACNKTRSSNQRLSYMASYPGGEEGVVSTFEGSSGEPGFCILLAVRPTVFPLNLFLISS